MTKFLAFDPSSRDRDAVVRPVPLTAGEPAQQVVDDILARPRPGAHIIVFANEKGGVGKSTLAFHCCVALGDAGYRVSAIDLDTRQHTLADALVSREGTARRLGIALPQPRHAILSQPSAGMLSQEMGRIGSHSDIIVIDAPGHDSAIARRAIALADTLVTPINNSFVDLNLLGRFDPVTLALRGPGYFARLVEELREARAHHHVPPFDWLVVPNRVRQLASHNRTRIETALASLQEQVDFRLSTGLTERVAYRELFLLGLTHLDLRHIPELRRTQLSARRELLRLVEDLALPPAAAEPERRSATG